MARVWGALRRLAMAPALFDVTFAARGFPGAGSPAAPSLEAVPQAVICGFEWGIEAGGLWEVQRRLDLVDPVHRGFAYEGATMAFTIRDVLGRPGRRTRELLEGPGERHIFLAYIGIGFAMARLPRQLWRKVVPDLPVSAYHPTMSWLAVDGYGFDRAYFDTTRWVDRAVVPDPYPWQGDPGYFSRAVDQGIGRALWFVHGATVPAVAAAVGRFAEHRRADLWSGVGLAATFAGGCDRGALRALRTAAGESAPHLCQGAVFAVKARHHAGLVPEHTEWAANALTGLSVADAVRLADDTVAGPRDGGPEPAYEIWRRRIRDHFVPVRPS
ncbi:DUF1702 family protein [Actinoplanes siamensis]|uniref:Enediyne biosynthesis protein n=1 Tax=Actinoplanes siamensis TaxID=1223317 RepID=A0A919NCA7_9ACTN|nr:DUF1702 family protein [Actinoplanes siamensis]GIF08486.1 hypothetical protein Asi03nite_60240 [Actinoplanes siamensis]